MLDELLSAIRDYERLKKEADKDHPFPLEQARREAENIIIKIIDDRINSTLGRLRRSTTNAAGVKTGFTEEMIVYIEALNSAPTPPESLDDSIAAGTLSLWFDEYKNWFYSKRKRALK